MYGPKLFHIKDEGSYPVKVDNAFEETCAWLQEHTSQPVKQLTVREFYRLIDVVKKKQKNS